MSKHSIIDEAGQVIGEVSDVAREIVVKRVIITTTLAGVLGALVAAHVVPLDLSTKLQGVVGVVFTVLVAVTGGFAARAGVTPADIDKAPLSSDGQVLVTAQAAALHTATVLTSTPPSVADGLVPVTGESVIPDSTPDAAPGV